jgi:hypothetical protein
VLVAVAVGVAVGGTAVAVAVGGTAVIVAVGGTAVAIRVGADPDGPAVCVSGVISSAVVGAVVTAVHELIKIKHRLRRMKDSRRRRGV